MEDGGRRIFLCYIVSLGPVWSSEQQKQKKNDDSDCPSRMCVTSEWRAAPKPACEWFPDCHATQQNSPAHGSRAGSLVAICLLDEGLREETWEGLELKILPPHLECRCVPLS